MKSALEIDGLRELGTHHLASLRTRIPLGATANGCYGTDGFHRKHGLDLYLNVFLLGRTQLREGCTRERLTLIFLHGDIRQIAFLVDDERKLHLGSGMILLCHLWELELFRDEGVS